MDQVGLLASILVSISQRMDGYSPWGSSPSTTGSADDGWAAPSLAFLRILFLTPPSPEISMSSSIAPDKLPIEGTSRCRLLFTIYSVIEKGCGFSTKKVAICSLQGWRRERRMQMRFYAQTVATCKGFCAVWLRLFLYERMVVSKVIELTPIFLLT
jgi:hypothetical protein